MIVSGEVEQSVQDKDTDFIFGTVTETAGIADSDVEGYRNVAREPGLYRLDSRERDNIGWLILAAERAIQRAHLPIAGEQQAYVALETNGPAGGNDEAPYTELAHTIDVLFDIDHFVK
jgi:hypothetical protein